VLISSNLLIKKELVTAEPSLSVPSVVKLQIFNTNARPVYEVTLTDFWPEEMVASSETDYEKLNFGTIQEFSNVTYYYSLEWSMPGEVKGRSAIVSYKTSEYSSSRAAYSSHPGHTYVSHSASIVSAPGSNLKEWGVYLVLSLFAVSLPAGLYLTSSK
jgi:hypothetical protein